MENIVALNLNLESTAKLNHFKEYAVSHPQLLQVYKLSGCRETVA